MSRYRPRESRARPRKRTLLDQSEACPPFFAAVEQLRGLLSSRGHPAEVVWLFREDFYHASARQPIVRMPLPAQNAELAERYFEAGRVQGQFPQLHGQFEVDGRSGCTLWFPDQLAPGGTSLLTTLVLSAAAPFVVARQVRSSLGWRVHQLRPIYRANQRQGFDVPRRCDLLP